MIPPSFDYHVPNSVNDAIGMLRKYGSDAKILSGGMSLIPLMKLRLANPAYLIDINRISGLDHIKEADGFLRIGALVREADLEKSELIRSKYPLAFGHDPSYRGPSGAKPRHDRWKFSSWRSSQRPSGDHVGAGSRDRGCRASRGAKDTGHELFYRPVHYRLECG